MPANVTVTPATVNIASGQTTGSFTYTGVAPGASTISASANNYQPGSATVTATYSLVSLGTIPAVAPGQSVSLALSIATAAPAGGLTINFTSSNPNAATVTSSVFIPQGQRTAATNPQIVGVAIGTTTITATAPGYAPDTRSVNVTVVASFTPGSISIAHQTYSTITLNISYPATTGGLTFSLSSDTPATATVPASVTIPAGQTSATVALTGVADGSTTIRADSAGVTEATLAVNVSTQLGLYYGNTIVGVNLQTANYAQVPTSPATPVTVTVTIANPAVATISTGAGVVGGATVTFTNVTSYSNNLISIQGQSLGTTTVTISAPGYTTGTNTITVYPSGFILAGNGITTTTLSGPTSVFIYSAILNPQSLTEYSTANLNPGLANISVPVTSSNTTVGTITTSPVIFPAGTGSENTTFQPSSAGTSTISVGTPSGVAGFSTPAASLLSYTATVTAPQLGFYYGNETTGVNMQVENYASIPQSPLSATTFTVTSSNPAVATLSTVATTVGTASVTYPNVTSSGNLPLFIQGQSVGTTTLTISGSGYTNGTITVTVDPSGFTFGNSSGFSTTSFSSPTGLTVYPTILNPGSLTEYTTGTLNPGIGPISVALSSSNTNVGTIVTTPVVLGAGSYSATSSFQPVGPGTTAVTIGQVTGGTGFTTPAASATTFNVTVTAPSVYFYSGNPVAGVNMIVQNYAYLGVAPPNPVVMTLTSSNPAVATLSANATTVGGASVIFPASSSTGYMSFFIQGQTTGTSTLTLSAPGYNSVTTTVTVYPSGFSFAGANGFSTTTFSAPTTVTVYASILNPGSLTYYSTGTLSPGVSSVSVPITSSNTTVGTISASPFVFSAGGTYLQTTFQPTSAGTSTIALGAPSGGPYSTSANYTSMTATVTAPQLSFYGNVLTGANLQVSTYVYVPVAPPNPVTVTVTSNGPAIATLSSSATVVGSTTVAFPNVTTAGYLSLYVQGQGVGTTTLTVSAPGYTNAVTNVTVDPSGFTFAGSYNSGLSTSSTSGPTTVAIYPTVLNPGSLTEYTTAMLNPGLSGTSVGVTSSNTATGTVTSPIIFNGGETYLNTSFQPLAAGTTNINLVQPTGFTTASQYTGFTATVH